MLRSAFFLGKRARKTVRIVKTTAVAKCYSFRRHTIFSTAGSFGFGSFGVDLLESLFGHFQVSQSDLVFKGYDQPDQLQTPRTPDLGNSRKTAEKGAGSAPGKVPEKQPKNSRKNTRSMQNSCFSAVWLPVRLFFGCFPGTLPRAHSAPFSAVFRLFPRSGVRGLCSWPGRS